MASAQFDRVWRQSSIPVIVRGGHIAPLVIKLPFRDDNKDWLRDDQRSKPKWFPDYKVWSIPKSWFENTVRLALARFGSIWVIQPYREIEKCAPACWNATGVHCECSCLGERHGTHDPAGRWYIINETLALRIGEKEFSCKLLRRRERPKASASARPIRLRF